MAAIPEIMAGAAGALYVNSGTYNMPVWGEFVTIKDVKPQYPWTYTKSQSRETPVDLYVKTKVDLPVQVVMRADPASSEYTTFVGAHWDRTAIEDLLILNAKKTVVGASGTRG